jgi:DNA-binding transcriptional ArsR family regulator
MYTKESLMNMSVNIQAFGEEADTCPVRCIHPEHVFSVQRALVEKETAVRVASLFGVLADPTRLQVVYALLHAPTGELCVCDLAAGLSRDDTTISHQLRVLRHQQVVATRKEGRIVYYRLVDEHIRQLLTLGMTHTAGSCTTGQTTEEVVR